MMTQNELYELVADFGTPYGKALRRDIYLAKGVDWPENWLELAVDIGQARAEALKDGLDSPTHHELQSLLSWQVARALSQDNPDLVATLWLCQTAPDEDVIAVEGWGRSLHTELNFQLIGYFPDETSAIKELKSLYLFSADDLEEPTRTSPSHHAQ